MLTYDLEQRGKLARYDYLYRCIKGDLLAGRLGAGAIRLDTYSLNRPMLALIAGQGFQKVGEIRLHGRPLPYPCFEKAL